jgi:sulfite reductase alpha subunit-like flavoprotein
MQSSLPGERFVVFVVSTTGQGDPPDSMKVWIFCSILIDSFLSNGLLIGKFGLHFFLQGFWRYLLRKDLSSQWLEGVCYAVFGLGDSGYQKYNVRLLSGLLSFPMPYNATVSTFICGDLLRKFLMDGKNNA